ncbi:MAG: hypothetical protein DRQ47_09385 [Gammaproteobacteria bacterium]|nr:MAG: hypothetical protein DRQ47_09385 [Gammaproteobacteria bacterium]
MRNKARLQLLQWLQLLQLLQWLNRGIGERVKRIEGADSIISSFHQYSIPFHAKVKAKVKF